MAMSNVELYEALRGSIPETAARVIAEAFVPTRDLATRQDLAALESSLRGEIKAASTSTMRWMLTFFVPVWVGTWATVIAIILKG
jgi:hypothetical protein